MGATSAMTDEMKDRGWDAILSGWKILRVCTAGAACTERVVIAGVVSLDRTGRWPDGRAIVTSLLRTEEADIVPGAVVLTLNSRYLLGHPQGATIN